MATSTPYASGLKKPLNMIENPVYPDIKKGPPRFVWSRKHWNVDNPGVSEQYQTDLSTFSEIDNRYINDKHINYSYEVYKEVPVYREQNVLSNRPSYREKLQPVKSYSSGYSQTGCNIPRGGIDQPSITKKRNNKYIVNKKTPTYKI